MNISDGHPCYIIAEIGINHNGSLEIAKQMIDEAVSAQANAVKFQKRTPELCVPVDQRGTLRDTPWGRISYMDYRQRMEFSIKQYAEIDRYCYDRGIDWFASCWDYESVEFIAYFDVPYFKVASASLTDDSLLQWMRLYPQPVILSTGMSSLEQIDHAVDVLGEDDLILLHCCSAYPAYNDELNLRTIQTLRQRYDVPVGYSGHELATATTVAAVVLGACVVERHLTLDRKMWGSDQRASLEPGEFAQLVRDIRWVEAAMGDGVKRVQERELPVMEKLRRL